MAQEHTAINRFDGFYVFAILKHLDDWKIELQSSIDIIYYMLYADKKGMQWRMKDESVVCPVNSS
jgi:hypothetical protein